MSNQRCPEHGRRGYGWCPTCVEKGEVRACATCGTLTSRGRTYCSRTCMNAGRVGDKNNNWKGGVSKENSRYTRNFKRRYPEKKRAHEAVRLALQSGRLVPQPCAACGREEQPHAHHFDYSKPLDVTWLCQPCHYLLHRLIKLRAKLDANQMPVVNLLTMSAIPKLPTVTPQIPDGVEVS